MADKGPGRSGGEKRRDGSSGQRRFSTESDPKRPRGQNLPGTRGSGRSSPTTSSDSRRNLPDTRRGGRRFNRPKGPANRVNEEVARRERKPLIEDQLNTFVFDDREVLTFEPMDVLAAAARNDEHFEVLSRIYLDSHFHPEDLTRQGKSHDAFDVWMAEQRKLENVPVFGGGIIIQCNPTAFVKNICDPPGEDYWRVPRLAYTPRVKDLLRQQGEDLFPLDYATGIVRGTHPKWAATYCFNQSNIDRAIKDLAQWTNSPVDEPPTVAIGETGFCFKSVEHAVIGKDLCALPGGSDQLKALCGHIRLANELHLPLVLHVRGGSEELTDQLELYALHVCEQYLDKDLAVIRHCFTSSGKMAELWRSRWPKVYISHAPCVSSHKPQAFRQQCSVQQFTITHQMAESDAPHFAEEKTWLGNPGSTLRGIRKIYDLRGVQTEPERRVINYYLNKTVIKAYSLDAERMMPLWKRFAEQYKLQKVPVSDAEKAEWQAMEAELNAALDQHPSTEDEDVQVVDEYQAGEEGKVVLTVYPIDRQQSKVEFSQENLKGKVPVEAMKDLEEIDGWMKWAVTVTTMEQFDAVLALDGTHLYSLSTPTSVYIVSGDVMDLQVAGGRSPASGAGQEEHSDHGGENFAEVPAEESMELEEAVEVPPRRRLRQRDALITAEASVQPQQAAPVQLTPPQPTASAAPQRQAPVQNSPVPAPNVPVPQGYDDEPTDIDPDTGLVRFSHRLHPMSLRRRLCDARIDMTTMTGLEPFHECTGQGDHHNCPPMYVKDLMPDGLGKSPAIRNLRIRCPIQAILVRNIGRNFRCAPPRAVEKYLEELLKDGTSMSQAIFIFEKHSEEVQNLPEVRLRFSQISTTDIGAAYKRWVDFCRVARRFATEHPRGPLTTDIDFNRTHGRFSLPTWKRLNFTHAIDQARCKSLPQHRLETYLADAASEQADCETLILADNRGIRLCQDIDNAYHINVGSPGEALGRMRRTYLPYCIKTIVICCGADRLASDPQYTHYVGDLQELGNYLSRYYPHCAIRVLHPTYIPRCAKTWKDVICDPTEIFKNQFLAVDGRESIAETPVVFMNVPMDWDLYDIHQFYGASTMETVDHDGYLTTCGRELRKAFIYRTYDFYMGDMRRPAGDNGGGSPPPPPRREVPVLPRGQNVPVSGAASGGSGGGGFTTTQHAARAPPNLPGNAPTVRHAQNSPVDDVQFVVNLGPRTQESCHRARSEAGAQQRTAPGERGPTNDFGDRMRAGQESGRRTREHGGANLRDVYHRREREQSGRRH